MDARAQAEQRVKKLPLVSHAAPPQSRTATFASRRLLRAHACLPVGSPQLARSSPLACGALAHSAGRPSLDYLRRRRPLDDNVHPTAERPLFAGPPDRRSKKLPLVTVRAEGHCGPSQPICAPSVSLCRSPPVFCHTLRYRIGCRMLHRDATRGANHAATCD